MRPLIFICAPLTPRDGDRNAAEEYLANCRETFLISTDLIKLGFTIYCPATDFPFFWVDRSFPVELVYQQDLGMIDHADAVYEYGRTYLSPNCKAELDRAKARGLEILYSLGDAKRFIEQWKEEWDDDAG